jgi:type IV pilus assembly protein PilV
MGMKSNNGFALFEVLIAVVVLSVGLLGLAGLEVTGQRNNHSAYLRSQAVFLAYDMVDRMRANMQGMAAGDYDNISGIPADPGCITAGCTPAELAQYDAYQWNTLMAQQLPSGQGTVTAAGALHTITVMWDDDRSGGAGVACSAGGLKCLTLSVQL